MKNEARKTIVIGASLAGLLAALRACERGDEVLLFCHDRLGVCADINRYDRINVVEPQDHEAFVSASVLGAHDLLDAPSAKKLADQSCHVFDLLRHWQVLFDHKHFKTRGQSSWSIVQPNLGKQLVNLLTDFVRSLQSEGKIHVYEHWSFLSAVIDDSSQCHGVVMVDRRTLQPYVYKADRVIVATGSGASMSQGSFGSASILGQLANQGALLSNLEARRVSPFHIKLSSTDSSVSFDSRGDWTNLYTKDGDTRRYLFETIEHWQAVENKSETMRAVLVDLLGAKGTKDLYYDASQHADEDKKWFLKLCRGCDLAEIPAEIQVAEIFGGLWVDENQKTSVHGLYAVGHAQSRYYGFGCLPGNDLLIQFTTALTAVDHDIAWQDKSEPLELFEITLNEAKLLCDDVLDSVGPETVFDVTRELNDLVQDDLLLSVYDQTNDNYLERLDDLSERLEKCHLTDRTRCFNMSAMQIIMLKQSLSLLRMMHKAVLTRKESRGHHFRYDFSCENELYRKTSKLFLRFQGDVIVHYEDLREWDHDVIKRRAL